MIDASAVYREQEVLITGANGFVGKVVLALLIDRFPDLKHLHLLMRGKRGVSPRERFDRDVLTAPCLDPIVKRARPELLRDRISVHAGDVGEPFCGLADDTLAALEGRVKLIINCAGLVDFTPPVDQSFKSNVDGAEHALALAKRLGAKLVHISTCFVCGECDGLVEEDEPIIGFYPRRRGHDDQSFRHADEIRYIRDRVKETYEWAAKQGLPSNHRELKQRLSDLGMQRAAQWGWVNTYTYSKSLGEQLIASQSEVPFTMVRPAIVEAALEFPFPGWVEGGRTAAPLIMMAMSGLRHWPLNAEAPLEVVPVDQVATAILAAGAALANGQADPVYQLGTAAANPIPLKKLVEWMYAEYLKGKGRPSMFFPGVRILAPAESQRRGSLLVRRIQRAHQVTNSLRRTWQKSNLPGHARLSKLATSLRMLGLQASVREQALLLYQPFMHDNRFVFEADNIRDTVARLNKEDQAKLPWTPEKIHWRTYWIENEVKGILKWVQGEDKGWSFKL